MEFSSLIFVENQRLDLSREPQRLKPRAKAMFIAGAGRAGPPKIGGKKIGVPKPAAKTGGKNSLLAGFGAVVGEESPCGRWAGKSARPHMNPSSP
jgi:hypothetical protein